MRVNSILNFPKLRVDFWSNYAAEETQVDARLGKFFPVIGSTMASEMFGYAQAAPVARYWAEGDAIPSDEFLTNLFPQRSWKFGVGVEISQTSIEDDQSKMIMSRVMESAVSFAMLRERHFYWLLTGGATIDAIQMQPQLPTAPDGAAWASATDGAGNARFGVTGGNIQATSGVGTPQAIINDMINGMARMASFLNQENQPYFNPGDVQREIAILFNSANFLNFKSATSQMFVVAASGNAAPTNVAIDADLKVVSIPNPRITNNNWSICATNAKTKAPFWLERVAPKEVVGEPGNSDTAREWDVFKLYVRSRGAIGLNLPTAWVFVQ
jgi:hypothetical protein